MERSFDEEAKVGIQFSLLWFWSHFVDVSNIPLLVQSVVFLPNNDVSVLCVDSTVDVKDLASLIDDVSTSVSEELEPSGIGVPDLQVARSSSRLNIQ